MAIDPSTLRPSQLTRLLNSTPLGTVIGERQMYTHRQRAGFRISPDGRTVNLFKYLAWLVDERHGPQPEQTARDYESMKEAARARNAALSAAGRDIGDLPEVVDPERSERCRTSFRGFCEAYFSLTFHLPWSPDHLRVITKIEQAVMHGGLFAMAMPRGSGKALALDTPLPTPSGWTTMGDVRVGDWLFDEIGHPCQVQTVSPVMTGRPCFEVRFSDGERIVCDADHLWAVEESHTPGRPRVLTTEDMAACTPGHFYVAADLRLEWDGTRPVRLHHPSRPRHIVAITPVPSVPVKCVQVSSRSHLYLAGRKIIPTHNSTLAECSCLWAMLYGHRDFVTLIGSDEGHALGMLDSIKTELESNDLLLEDFPAVCYPIHSLEGIANRCSGQLYKGNRTQIGWTANEIVLPTIAGSEASGAIIRVAGITGRIRGMKFKRPDGQTVRPSLVILDDPQTDESARSLSQCANRERILAGAVLGLAGPGKKISGIMPCTVIRPGDMADRILDREKHPEWNGERTKMVNSFPTDEKLWERYAEIRADSLRQKGDLSEATAFYVAHREKMDEGADVAWAARFNYDEASALQHAMNLKLQDEGAFWAEYQNEPLPENVGEDEELTVDEITQKLNGYKRGEIPIGCNHLSMFIDVQGKLLYWAVCAWESDFSGYLIDYGAFPDQNRPYFTLRDASPTLLEVKAGAGLEGSIYAGLEALTGRLLAREWQRDDGAMIKISRCLIDANWGTSTDVVYQFCRQSAHAAVLFPSHGRYVGASSLPFTEYKKKRGDRVGHNWRIPNVQGKRAIRHVLYDTNYWKSFIFARLAVPMGDRGCLSLYGRDPVIHQLFAEHLTAEYRVKTTGRGRVVDEWKLRPEASDNHWLDGIVGCAVGASIEGVVLPGTQGVGAPKRERIKLSALRPRRR